MRKVVVLTVLAALILFAGCASLTTPKSTTGAVAYAGATLQAVEETAAAEYPNMPKAQVEKMHALILQAQTMRAAAIAAADSGDPAAATNKLQALTAVLTQIQGVLKEYAHGK